jgi:hypothetical protein
MLCEDSAMANKQSVYLLRSRLAHRKHNSNSTNNNDNNDVDSNCGDGGGVKSISFASAAGDKVALVIREGDDFSDTDWSAYVVQRHVTSFRAVFVVFLLFCSC